MGKRTGRAPAPVAAASSSKGRSAARTRGRPAAGPNSIHDVYDYAVEHAGGAGGKGKVDRSIRRAKLGSGRNDMDDVEGGGRGSRPSRRPPPRRDGDDDEDVGSGSGSDSDSDDSASRRRQAGPSFLDASDDEEAAAKQAVASDDDSDIDSDDAFADSDDEMGMGSGKGSKARARGDADSSDDDDDEGADDFEDDQGSDIVDLSRLLDDDGGAGGGGGDVFGDDDDEDDDDDEEDEESEEDATDRLSRLAASYAQASKRSADDDDNDDATTAPASSSKRQRRLLSARTEVVPESEYAAMGPSSSSSRGGINIDDLLGSLNDNGGAGSSSAGDLAALRANTKALRQAQRSSGGLAAPDARQPVASRRGGGALSAPLADVVKDRLQRSAGYDLSKEEADKWQSTIKRLREAEHLSFPLQGGPSRPKASTAQLAASYKPTNALEQDIESLLQAQGLSESQIAKSEELAMRKIDPEEAARRRDELRQMRELMFRAEQKAKRTNKIKSKAFRKIARKDKERQRQKMIAAGIIPGDDDDDEDGEDGHGGDASASRAKAERLRAKERATLKHKNTGKWAKGAFGKHGASDDVDDTREAINEQLRRSDQLRRRIQGLGVGQGDDDDSGGESGDDDDDDAVQSAFDEIRALEAREQAEAEADAGAGADGNAGKKGVWNMKFMKDARNRDDAAARTERRELEDELRRVARDASDGGEDRDDDEDDSDEDEEAAGRPPVIGRRTFESKGSGGGLSQGTAAGASRRAVDVDSEDGDGDGGGHADADEASNVESATPAAAATSRRPLSQAAQVADDASDATANPWLVAKSHPRKSNANAPTQSASSSSLSAAKSAAKLDKHKQRSDSTRRAEIDDDAQVDIDPNALIATKAPKRVVQVQPAPAANANAANAGSADSDSDSDSDSGSEAEPIEIHSAAKGRRANKATLSQRDLIAEAFAGDDVTADFAASKAKAIADDAPQQVDDTLPGWGSWGGKGAKRTPASRRQQRVKVVPGLDPSKRKDANMSNVIINERRDKKLDKYRAKELPYPYTSAQQYQASIAQPIGPEWNTTTQNQRLVMPRVLQTKPGAVIKPVQRIG